jgi:hypothetical protein
MYACSFHLRTQVAALYSKWCVVKARCVTEFTVLTLTQIVVTKERFDGKEVSGWRIKI